MAVRLLERPADEIRKLCEHERLCDSTRIDNTVRPFRVISHCFKPAEWVYVMKCCGAHALACNPCHEQHLQPPLYPRYCAHCSDSFSTLADARVPYIGCRARAMRLDEPVRSPLRLTHPTIRIMPGSGATFELREAVAINEASINSTARHLLRGAHRSAEPT